MVCIGTRFFLILTFVPFLKSTSFQLRVSVISKMKPATLKTYYSISMSFSFSSLSLLGKHFVRNKSLRLFQTCSRLFRVLPNLLKAIFRTFSGLLRTIWILYRHFFRHGSCIRFAKNLLRLLQICFRLVARRSFEKPKIVLTTSK